VANPPAGAVSGAETATATPPAEQPPGAPVAAGSVPVLPVAPAAASIAGSTSRSPQSAPGLGNGSFNQPTRESAAARPAPLPAPPRPPEDDGDYGVSPARIGLIVGGGVAAVAVAVVVVLSMTGKDSPPPPNKVGATPAAHSPQKSTSGSPTAGSTSSSALTSAERRATHVAVLNGTTQNGLARAVADTVEAKGFTIAGPGTNPDQDIQTTTISYTPGNKEAALEVAKVVQIDRSSVQPVDTTTSAAPDADVVVIVGADKSG
jgi:hypothetical protein